MKPKSDAGKLVPLQGGQVATSAKGRAPAVNAKMKARPQDAVAWALYYEPVLYAKSGSPAPDSLASTAPPPSSPRAAWKMRAVGSRRGPEEEPEGTLDALALTTIVNLAREPGQDQALAMAERAVAAIPSRRRRRSPCPTAAGAFDLEGARASLEQAVKLDPEGRARLGAARRDPLVARRIAARSRPRAEAAELEPNLARTQTVLGFAPTGCETDEAAAAFPKAIALDRADPLPRLGLGLAKIREGELAEGATEIEIAASLDPSNALVRSYLGKAYFEEKRGDLDEREYDAPRSSTRTTRRPGSTTRSPSRPRTVRSRRSRASRRRSS